MLSFHFQFALCSSSKILMSSVPPNDSFFSLFFFLIVNTVFQLYPDNDK